MFIIIIFFLILSSIYVVIMLYYFIDKYIVYCFLQVPSLTMEHFLNKIEEGYSRHHNPYHNNLHGADVAQTVHYMLYQTGLMVITNIKNYFKLLSTYTTKSHTFVNL